MLLKNAIIYFWCIYKTLNSLKQEFLNKKLGIISERLTRDLMIRPTQSSTSSFPVSSLLPKKLLYCNILYIQFCLYFTYIVLSHFMILYTGDFQIYLQNFESIHIAKKNRCRIAMSLRNMHSETCLYSLFQISSSNILCVFDLKIHCS